MSHPSKVKGTRGETGVVKALRANGFPTAERRALHGTTDLGDILATVGVIVSVKAGDAAKYASHDQIVRWLRDAETQRLNAGADLALLVTQRAGFGPDRAESWWAHLFLRDVALLCGTTAPAPALRPVRMLLTDALWLVRAYGYGEAVA